MWLQLAVTEADLSALIGRLLPLRFDLPGEGRWLELRPPATLAMLPEVGAQLSCPAQLAYAVVGLQPSSPSIRCASTWASRWRGRSVTSSS